MITIDTTEDAATDLLVAIAMHAGPHAELGRPVMAVGDSIVTDLGPDTGLITLDGITAVRTVALASGLHEVTRWCGGRELSRVVG